MNYGRVGAPIGFSPNDSARVFVEADQLMPPWGSATSSFDTPRHSALGSQDNLLSPSSSHHFLPRSEAGATGGGGGSVPKDYRQPLMIDIPHSPVIDHSDLIMAVPSQSRFEPRPLPPMVSPRNPNMPSPSTGGNNFPYRSNLPSRSLAETAKKRCSVEMPQKYQFPSRTGGKSLRVTL